MYTQQISASLLSNSKYRHKYEALLQGKMANFFRINCVLRIEIEQLEEKLKFIKQVEWLNLSVERLTHDYNCKIATKKAQIIDNQAAASNIVAAAMQQ